MIHSKQCYKCESVKPLDEFYANPNMADGHVNKCKECSKKDSFEYRKKNIERLRAYDRDRDKTPERIMKSFVYSTAWRADDRRRMKSHKAVARALKKGLLVPESCKQCGSHKTVAHHEDYDKPLDVVWLCQPCHIRRHVEIRKARCLNHEVTVN